MSERGIWNGDRYVKAEDDLKRECLYCGYCGTKMGEVLHPAPSFHRKTGKQGQRGSLHWECPKRGIGLDGRLGDWVHTHDENPHDSVYLRET